MKAQLASLQFLKFSLESFKEKLLFIKLQNAYLGALKAELEQVPSEEIET